MSRSIGSSDTELALKFLFANQDGMHVTLRFPKNTSVSEVKTQLMQNWPSGMYMRNYDISQLWSTKLLLMA